ncbi:MAG TPA: HEPN domain-containing protein [Thermoanaerobaculia bacterium]|nr:HEPN domain-containing protein [Thermoanaerobaculia bacterium]
MGELHERYVMPLRDLLVIAGAVPDALLFESVTIGRQPSAVVLETGIEPTVRDWPRPDRQFLFYALDIPDFRAGLKKWFALHTRVSPALQYLAESINEDKYSHARLLSVASTLETYHRSLYDAAWRRTYKRKNPNKKTRGPFLLERITHLQRISGVPEGITGFSEARRQLFVASRNHFAHLNEPRYGYSIDQDVYDNAIPSIARGVALVHACVMRRLGFTARQTKERIELIHGHLVISARGPRRRLGIGATATLGLTDQLVSGVYPELPRRRGSLPDRRVEGRQMDSRCLQERDR